MHPLRKQRLILVIAGVVLSSLAIGLVIFAMRQNLDAFYPPSKMAAGDVPHNRNIRGGGCVKPGSVVRSTENLNVEFLLTDGTGNVKVKYAGILPDLFAEGEAAVVTGSLDDQGVFNAEQVLAKHDENYTPPEVADSLKSAHKNADARGVQDQKMCKGMSYGS